MFKAVKSLLIGGTLAVTFGLAADVVTQATIENPQNKDRSPVELPKTASDFAALLGAGAAAYAYGRSQKGNNSPKP